MRNLEDNSRDRLTATKKQNSAKLQKFAKSNEKFF